MLGMVHPDGWRPSTGIAMGGRSPHGLQQGKVTAVRQMCLRAATESGEGALLELMVDRAQLQIVLYGLERRPP
jgi:hypothetical protein